MGSSPITRTMNKKLRLAALVVDTLLIILNLSVFFTTLSHGARAFSLAVAMVCMCLFILDWNAWLKK